MLTPLLKRSQLLRGSRLAIEYRDFRKRINSWKASSRTKIKTPLIWNIVLINWVNLNRKDSTCWVIWLISVIKWTVRIRKGRLMNTSKWKVISKLLLYLTWWFLNSMIDLTLISGNVWLLLRLVFSWLPRFMTSIRLNSAKSNRMKEVENRFRF